MDAIDDGLFVDRADNFDYVSSSDYAIGHRATDIPIVRGFPSRELANLGLTRLRQRVANGERPSSIDVKDWRVFVDIEDQIG
jgi:hypothetical protein